MTTEVAKELTPKEKLKIAYEKLSKPFPKGLVRYRESGTNKTTGDVYWVPYVSVRHYVDRLNSLLLGNWEVSYQTWGDYQIIARLTILGFTQESTGEYDPQSKGNSHATKAEAQAFKRACAMFGLGRHIADLPKYWLPKGQQPEENRRGKS